METWIYFSIEGTFNSGNCGIFLTSSELFKTPVWAGWQIVGGKGATITGNGIWLGRGATQMLIFRIDYLKSDNIPEVIILSKPKKVNPPLNAHYFVKGVLITEIVNYPLWNEKVYYLNGQKLENEPNSWGAD